MTARLSGLAKRNWRTIDGFAVGHAVGDLEELPLERFVNFIWWFFTRNAEQKDVDKFEAKVWQPPVADMGKPIDPRSPWSPENEMKAFGAVKAQLAPGK